MKTVIIILIFFSFNASAQHELREEFYPNGNPFSKGNILKTQMDNGGGSIMPIGFWKYWYEDGALNSEVFYTKNSIKYINMWQPNQTQILKNGQGFIVKKFTYDSVTDSTVYMVRDSILNGNFKKFQKSKNDKKYKLTSEGNYVNGKKEGMVWFKNHKMGIQIIEHFSNGKKHGKCIRKNKDELIYEGQYCLDKHSGKWKYYKNGILHEIRSFQDGKEQGSYLAFYKNGKVKTEGNFVRHLGIQNTTYIDMETDEETTVQEKKEVSVRHGLWKTYDKKGVLIKTEKFEFGKLIN